MRGFSFAVWSLFFSLLSITPAHANKQFAWTVGQEHEVDEGIYFKLLKIENGWRLWRTETRFGVDCIAVKSAVGEQPAVPMGVAGLFSGGLPRLVIHWSDWRRRIEFGWEGKHLGEQEVLLRNPGERFWADAKSRTSFTDGEKIEVDISSWEYPEIFLGFHEAKGVIDLTGLDAMRTYISQCHPPAAVKSPDPAMLELDKKYPEYPD